jgi:FkbM family methyltransferase
LSIRIIHRLSNIAKRHWAERQCYRRSIDWLMSIYNRILIHSRPVPLPGRGAIWTMTPAGLHQPVHLRLASSDWYVMEEIFFNQEYGPLVKRHPNQIRTVLDLGSNIGMSIRLWQTLWPNANVIGVEPDQANVLMAKSNLIPAANEPGLIQACVAARPRAVHLDRSGNEYSFRMAEGVKDDKDRIDALTISQIMERAGLNGPIDLLKCDVEGAEAEIFADCRAWIPLCRYLVVEVHAPYTAAELLAHLNNANVHPRWLEVVDKGDVAVIFMDCTSDAQSTPALASDESKAN